MGDIRFFNALPLGGRFFILGVHHIHTDNRQEQNLYVLQIKTNILTSEMTKGFNNAIIPRNKFPAQNSDFLHKIFLPTTLLFPPKRNWQLYACFQVVAVNCILCIPTTCHSHIEISIGNVWISVCLTFEYGNASTNKYLYGA